jgi:hypothetical protein
MRICGKEGHMEERGIEVRNEKRGDTMKEYLRAS